MNKRILASGLIAGILLTLMIVTAGAASIENITLSTYSGSVLQNGNVVVNYSVHLVNGTFSSGTELYIVQNRQLVNNGISVLLSNKYGNPPLSGVMYVFSSSTTPLGNYVITLAGNSTNIRVNAAVLKFDVVTKVTTSTSSVSTTTSTSSASTTIKLFNSTTATTTISNRTTVPTTTTAQKSSSGSGNASLYGVVIIVIILVVLVLLLMLRGKGNGTRPKPQVYPTQPAPKPPSQFQPPPQAPPQSPPPQQPQSPSQPQQPQSPPPSNPGSTDIFH